MLTLPLSKSDERKEVVATVNFSQDGRSFSVGQKFTISKVYSSLKESYSYAFALPCGFGVHWINALHNFSFVSSPTSTMPTIVPDPVSTAAELQLSSDEKNLRDSGLKDSCGKWTDAARQIFTEMLLMEKGHLSVMVSLAKKMIEATKPSK